MSESILRDRRAPAAFNGVVINLDRDGDRWLQFQARSQRAGLALDRLPGVLGTAGPAHLMSHFRCGEAYAPTLGPGEIGCYASHLRAAELCLTQGAPLLVLEDDADFDGDLADLIVDSLARAPAGWDIIRLSNPTNRPSWRVARLTGGRDLVRYSRIPTTTAGYLIAPSGAAKMLAMTSPRRRPVDEDMRRPWLNGLTTLGVLAPPVRQTGSPSTIAALDTRGRSARPAWKSTLKDNIGPHGWRLMHNLGQLGLWPALRCALAGRRASVLGPAAP